MSFKRKIERNKLKGQYKKNNRGIQKRYRTTFAGLWTEYQEKKYGKKQYAVMLKRCNNRKQVQV